MWPSNVRCVGATPRLAPAVMLFGKNILYFFTNGAKVLCFSQMIAWPRTATRRRRSPYHNELDLATSLNKRIKLGVLVFSFCNSQSSGVGETAAAVTDVMFIEFLNLIFFWYVTFCLLSYYDYIVNKNKSFGFDYIFVLPSPI